VNRLREELREQVLEVHTMAMIVCEKNKALKPDEEIQALIVDMVSLIRHHGDEYFWIIAPDGTLVFIPLPEKNLLSI